MKKFLLVVGLGLLIFLAACNTPAPTAQPPVELNLPTPFPKTPTATIDTSRLEEVLSATPTPKPYWEIEDPEERFQAMIDQSVQEFEVTENGTPLETAITLWGEDLSDVGMILLPEYRVKCGPREDKLCATEWYTNGAAIANSGLLGLDVRQPRIGNRVLLGPKCMVYYKAEQFGLTSAYTNQEWVRIHAWMKSDNIHLGVEGLNWIATEFIGNSMYLLEPGFDDYDIDSMLECSKG